MAWLGFSIHGTSVQPEVVGPDYLENIDGIHWSDIVGYRRGWGATFRGKANKFNWFHFAPPHLDNHDHRATTLFDLAVHFLTTGTAEVDSVHVWSGHVQLRTFDNLNNAGDFRAQSTMGKNWWLMEHSVSQSVSHLAGKSPTSCLRTPVCRSSRGRRPGFARGRRAESPA